ncbi:MAG: H-NS histone family protein [Burkholderiaceae bacterium]|jgi:DNA-binding protein H-NS|nr:H-NS histone family protein [Burkholderiaceae bacterium]
MATYAEIDSEIQKHAEKIEQLRKEAQVLRNQERVGVIEELRAKIAEYEISASDLKLSPRRSRRSDARVVKYRNPATGETWSGGRGRKPRWIQEALARGEDIARYKI